MQRFGLTPEEHDLVVLAGLAEEHEGLARTFRALHPLGEPRPSVGLAGLVLAEAGRDELRRLLAEGPAVGSGVLVVEGSGVLPERSLRLADRLWEVLQGVDARPAGLGVVTLDDVVPGLDDWLEEDAAEVAARAVRERAAVTILVVGDDPVVSTSRATALLASVGASAFAVRARSEDGHLSAAEMALADVHAVARDLVLVLVAGDLDPGGGPLDLPALPHLSGPVVVVALADACARTAGGRCWGCRPPSVSPAASRRPGGCCSPISTSRRPTRSPRGHRSTPALGRGDRGDAAASGLAPSPHTVASAVRRAHRGDAAAGGSADAAARRLGAPRPAAGRRGPAARRSRPARPPGQRARGRGGWRARPAPPAGSGCCSPVPRAPGKTLAAEVLATAAETDLLAVDLSRVVSKWIGETEKNLAAAFDVAERTQAVLFFDEADALFGARTEICDAHDRYANLETAYLLQRHGPLRRARRAGHQPAPQHRPGVHAADGLRRRLPAARLSRAATLWTLHLPADHLGRRRRHSTRSPASTRSRAGGSATRRSRRLLRRRGSRRGRPPAPPDGSDRREYGKASLPYPGDPPRRTP